MVNSEKGLKMKHRRIKLNGFYELLTEKDHTRLIHIREVMENAWAKGTYLHPFFTLHGPQHSKEIEHIIEHVIGMEHVDHHRLEDILNQEQLFFLLSAVWLHDVGMISNVESREKELAKKMSIPIEDWVRQEHHNRSYEYIVKHSKELWLEDMEAEFIGLVCLAHRKEDLLHNQRFTRDHPNVRFLGALLRISDELDITSSRTPKELMEFRWDDMDKESQWHWLKHWCVIKAEPFHEELKDENPTLLRLNYQIILRIPDPKYRLPLWNKILDPIKNVLDQQNVDLILREKRITIDTTGFKYNLLPNTQPLPNGKDFEEAIKSFLHEETILPGKLGKFLEQVVGNNNAITFMINRQFNRLLNTGYQVVNCEQLGEIMYQYLSELSSSQNIQDIGRVRAKFRETYRVINVESSTDRVSRGVEHEWRQFLDLGWRLMSFINGDESTKRAHLIHLQRWLESDSNNLSEWVYEHEDSESLRCTSIKGLSKFGTDKQYNTIMKSTKDPNPSVRVEGVRALRKYFGPGTYERLGQILETDVDGEVRRTAETVLKNIINDTSSNWDEFAGSKVLIVDSETYLVPILTDSLEKRKIEVRVETEEVRLEELLRDWKPDLVLCELLEISCVTRSEGTGDQLPGLRLASIIRNQLGIALPFLATSIINPEEISAQLASIHAVYIRKPAGVDNFIRTIESLLSLSREKSGVGAVVPNNWTM